MPSYRTSAPPAYNIVATTYIPIPVTATVGAQGPQGIPGVTGPTGASSESLTGFNGSTSTGYTGSQGPTGYTGSKGPTGFTGPTGIQGLSGFTGPTGIQGLSGFTGPTGIQGLSGFTGPTGIQGLSGFTGPTGIQGFTGITGPTGTFDTTNKISAPAGITGNTGSFSYLSGSNVISAPAGITGNTGSFSYLTASNKTILSGPFVSQNTFNIMERIVVVTLPVSSTLTLDCSAGSVFYVTSSATANFAIILTNIPTLSTYPSTFIITLIIKPTATTNNYFCTSITTINTSNNSVVMAFPGGVSSITLTAATTTPIIQTIAFIYNATSPLVGSPVAIISNVVQYT